MLEETLVTLTGYKPAVLFTYVASLCGVVKVLSRCLSLPLCYSIFILCQIHSYQDVRRIFNLHKNILTIIAVRKSTNTVYMYDCLVDL